MPTPDYRMPAEWEPHRSTWLAWPHRRSDWPGKFAPIPWVYAEIVRALTRAEDVDILVRDEKQEADARKALATAHADPGRVRFHVCPNDRGWVRDSGPIFVRAVGDSLVGVGRVFESHVPRPLPDVGLAKPRPTLQDRSGGLVALDWRFTAWAKYPDWPVDDRIPAFVTGVRGVPAVQPMFGDHRVVLEGGGIDVNGAGLMLTTEECLLSKVQERNPPMGRTDYEAVFQQYLGVEKTLWLNRGIAGDDTHGHVDDLARFVNPRTVVLALEADPADENYEPTQENRERLQGMTDLDGSRLEVIPLPMPRPLWFRKQRLPASYANFLIANGVVIVPTFNDPADRVALGTLAEVFPGREVVGIHCVDLVWGLGTLHCMTQQNPQP